MSEMRVMTTGLCFPEGPVAMRDGSIALVEIERQTVTRVHPNGRTQVIARTGGGPNGLAIGPDGAFYVCNNGGFGFRYEQGILRPAAQASDYAGGRIERVDLDGGAVTVLYNRCGVTNYAAQTTSFSTRMEGSTSPTWASRAAAIATTAGYIMPWRTDRGSPKSLIRC